jgi:ankyrin repeat protein
MQDYQGRTALIHAVFQGNYQIVELLIAAGAELKI